jgi:hypothetical protein
VPLHRVWLERQPKIRIQFFDNVSDGASDIAAASRVLFPPREDKTLELGIYVVGFLLARQQRRDGALTSRSPLRRFGCPEQPYMIGRLQGMVGSGSMTFLPSAPAALR